MLQYFHCSQPVVLQRSNALRALSARVFPEAYELWKQLQSNKSTTAAGPVLVLSDGGTDCDDLSLQQPATN